MNGINCNIWIGQKDFNGINSSIEWYFLSDYWNLTDYGITKKRYPVPIQIIMYFPTKLDNNKYVIFF